jgi:glutathione S-transferase
MILVGQYDSPFVRRVAISLMALDIPFTRDTRSVFGDFDAIRGTNPLGRIPALVRDDGSTLIDSGAILDRLDREVGPERALIPPSGIARDLAMQRIALACGGVEKVGAAAYERLIRPSSYRWPEWIARCRVQGEGALAALDKLDWSVDARFDQTVISTGCFLSYVKMADPELMPPGKYKTLDALNARCEARREFRETSVSEYAVPRGT